MHTPTNLTNLYENFILVYVMQKFDCSGIKRGRVELILALGITSVLD